MDGVVIGKIGWVTGGMCSIFHGGDATDSVLQWKKRKLRTI